METTADQAASAGHQPGQPWQLRNEPLAHGPALLRDCLMALVDAAPGMVMVSNSQGRLLYVNDAGRQMLGLDPQASIAARTMFDIYSPQSCDLLLDEAIPTCLRSGMWRGRMLLLDSSGAGVPVSQVLMACRVREQGREVTTLSSIAWDMRAMTDIGGDPHARTTPGAVPRPGEDPPAAA